MKLEIARADEETTNLSVSVPLTIFWTRSGGTYDEGRETELTSLEDMQVNCEIG